MPDRQLLYYRPVEQVTRFDILISDPHKRNDPYTTIDGSASLTLQEVWEWLCDCGEWSFRVTAHNDPDNVFMSGLTTYKSLRAAVDGQALCNLCTATEEEADELAKEVHDRVLKEMKALYTQRQ